MLRFTGSFFAVVMVGLLLAGCSTSGGEGPTYSDPPEEETPEVLDVSGLWEGSYVMGEGESYESDIDLEFSIIQDGTQLSGSYAGGIQSGSIAGQVSGDTVRINTFIEDELVDGGCRKKYTGTIDGDTITGTYEEDQCFTPETGSFTVTKL